MKRVILFFVFVFFTLVAWSQSLPTKETNLKVYFHCANGKAKIERELAKKEGILAVYADLETKVVKVIYDSTKLGEQQLVQYFHEMGYLTEKSPANTNLNKGCSHKHDEGGHEHHDH